MPSRRRSAGDRGLGGPPRLSPARRFAVVAPALQRALSPRAAHPSDLGDRPDDSLRPRARDDRAARELVRARQPQSADDLHRSCLSPARRGLPDLHFGRRRVRSSSPRIIARSFDEWFLELMHQGGREYWFDPGSADHGDPWQLHRRHVAHPALPGRLRRFTDRVAALLHAGTDELQIATELGLSRGDVELIFRHLQHGGQGRRRHASDHVVTWSGRSVARIHREVSRRQSTDLSNRSKG